MSRHVGSNPTLSATIFSQNVLLSLKMTDKTFFFIGKMAICRLLSSQDVYLHLANLLADMLVYSEGWENAPVRYQQEAGLCR